MQVEREREGVYLCEREIYVCVSACARERSVYVFVCKRLREKKCVSVRACVQQKVRERGRC